MELSIFQQILESLKSSQKVAVALPVKPRLDHVASALALKKALKENGKEVQLVSSAPVSVGEWLPGFEQASSALGGKDILDIKIDTHSHNVDEIRYEISDDAAHILVTAKTGSFATSDVTVFTRSQRPDVIFLIGCHNFESLGEVFENNTDIFYDSPKINIDNSPANEYFGNINLVQMTSASISELVLQFIKQLSVHVDEAVATQLLSGIISSTYSFQESNTTPESLETASELVNSGADQQLIIRHLYKTKKLKVLKLWGRVLARIKTEGAVMFSSLTTQDFERSESEPIDAPETVKESLDNISDFRVVAVISELQNKVHLSIGLHKGIDAASFLLPFTATPPTYHKHREFNIYHFEISLSPTEAEQKLVEQAKKIPSV